MAASEHIQIGITIATFKDAPETDLYCGTGGRMAALEPQSPMHDAGLKILLSVQHLG